MDRIYHTWDKWECYPAGLYDSRARDRSLTDEQCREAYATFLRDSGRFRMALAGVLSDWPTSCEHYLSNVNMNRLAWLGQASLCYATGIPANYRGGFNRLTSDEQRRANTVALEALNWWLTEHGEPEIGLDDAKSRTQMDLY